MPHQNGHLRAVIVAMEGAPADVAPIVERAVVAGLTSNPNGGIILPERQLPEIACRQLALAAHRAGPEGCNAIVQAFRNAGCTRYGFEPACGFDNGIDPVA